tara:strand:+ start:421 stop:1734 length:1314 start_codon:yes stop_codon:yes gene_type:complete
MNTTNHKRLSWGRSKHQISKVFKPNNKNEIIDFLSKRKEKSFLSIGLMRSYGDSCLNKNGSLIDMSNINQVKEFDKKNGIIRVQSGISLDDLLKFIVPHGWYIQTSPGTKFVTVAGAICNDIHGKNHHKFGSFCNSINKIMILRSSGEVIDITEKEDPLFKATSGGLGLTGIILEVEIQLTKISSSYLDVETIPFNNLEEFFKLERESVNDYEFTVSWIDLTNKGTSFSKGIFQRANWKKDSIFKKHTSSMLKVPFSLGINLVQESLIKIFNKVYFLIALKRKSSQKIHYSSFFYPLDFLGGWNKLYGRKGFCQYQLVFPPDVSLAGLNEIFESLKRNKFMPRLCVLKTFGSIKSHGYLSFPMEGTTLTMDFPYQENKVKKLFSEFSLIVSKFNGKIYPAKDINIDKQNFKKYFKDIDMLSKFKDPNIESDFWKRVS